MKKYRLLAGAVISGFIALLAFLPQLMLDKDGGGITAVLVNVVTIFLYSFCCWAFNFYLIVGEGMAGKLRTQWARLFLSSVFAFVVSYILLYSVRSHLGQDAVFTFRQLYGRRRIIGVTLFRGSFVNAFLYFIAYILHLSTVSQRAILENQKLKHENLEARLFVLRQQLSPHFLFNSLGILNTLTADAVVHKYIIELSNIYRYLLTNHEGHLAVLEKEVDFINAYLYVVRERFEDALAVTVNINEADMQKKLPPAALQLLIENAIKHNIVSLDRPLNIQIYTTPGYIVVTNTLNQKRSESHGEGIGLHNIAERYRLLSGGEIIIEKTATEFTVKLPLL